MKLLVRNLTDYDLILTIMSDIEDKKCELRNREECTIIMDEQTDISICHKNLFRNEVLAFFPLHILELVVHFMSNVLIEKGLMGDYKIFCNTRCKVRRKGIADFCEMNLLKNGLGYDYWFRGYIPKSVAVKVTSEADYELTDLALEKKIWRIKMYIYYSVLLIPISTGLVISLIHIKELWSLFLVLLGFVIAALYSISKNKKVFYREYQRIVNKKNGQSK